MTLQFPLGPGHEPRGCLRILQAAALALAVSVAAAGCTGRRGGAGALISTSVPTRRPSPVAETPTQTFTPSPPAPSVTPTAATPTPAPTASLVAPTEPLATHVPRYTYRIVAVYPHDPQAFTQGLVIQDGRLYESTGRYGASSLREVELATGRVLRSIPLSEDLFGEGIAVIDGQIAQLTWLAGRGLVHDLETFDPIGEFSYHGEGWGLSYDGEQLVMSDGTSWLRFLDPDTFEELRRVEVREGTTPVARLNEIEFVNGRLLANVWGANLIVMIDPTSGQIVGWVDMAGLLDEVAVDHPVDVLNGIAYDRDTGRLFVTGKLWPALFEIELVESEGRGGDS